MASLAGFGNLIEQLRILMNRGSYAKAAPAECKSAASGRRSLRGNSNKWCHLNSYTIRRMKGQDLGVGAKLYLKHEVWELSYFEVEESSVNF